MASEHLALDSSHCEVRNQAWPSSGDPEGLALKIFPLVFGMTAVIVVLNILECNMLSFGKFVTCETIFPDASFETSS